MSENTSNNPNEPIIPSDVTIPDNYVALKPGNYKQRQDLLPYMSRKMTREDIDVYLPETPLGVGNARSVVFIYPQGTIEIVGEVYAWNKLVKPGIYSQWEKLRYLNDEIIVPRIENDEERKRNQNHHHAVYNQTLTLNDTRFIRRYPDKDEILEYRYVSFENQILTRDGNDKIYPIPILDGRLTIYPDGTFKTEGVVVESKKNTVIDQYGYLGDQDNYQNDIGFFDNVTKDDIQPFNVYKLISRNDDNSVTYGPIEVNERVTSTKPRNLPQGIIPVNDGKVTLYPRGVIQIEGTVLTETGFKITEGTYNFSDLIQGKQDNGSILYNLDYIDQRYIYRPTFSFYTKILGKDPLRQPIGNLYWNSKQVNNVPDKSVKVTEAVYVHRLQYHLQSGQYQVISNEDEDVVLFTYLPMKGWDTFVAYQPTDRHFEFMDNLFFKAGIDLGDRMQYPIVYPDYTGKVAGKAIYPKAQLNTLGNIVYYNYVDHTFFLNEFNPLSSAKRTLDESIKQDNLEYASLPEGNILVPYRNLENTIQGSVRLIKRDDALYLETTGHVIWKRENQYYVLGEGTVKLDTTWPELKEDKDGYIKVFDVDGYFTDEPIFFGKGERRDELETIDGIRRQEEGLFKLVKRNVTGYLSYYEKALIINHRNPVIETIFDEHGVPKEDISLYALDVTYTSEQSHLCLEYNAWRFNNTVPKYLSPAYVNKKRDNHFEGISKADVNFEVRSNKISPSSDTNGIYFHTRQTPSGKEGYYLIRNQELSEDGLKLQHVGLEVETGTHSDYTTATSVYVNFDAESERDKGIDYRRRIVFPKGWILADGPIIGTLEGNIDKASLNGREYYYRTSESFDRYEGILEKVDPFGRQLKCEPTLKAGTGFVDIWYDDPYFEEQSVQRVKLRKDRSMTALVINNKDNIMNIVETISGKGHVGAKIELIDVETNEVIATGIVDYKGEWSVNVDGVTVGKTYKVKQTLEEWDISTEDTFTVKPHFYREGDKITADTLFGLTRENNQPIYLRPVNLRNKANPVNTLNLIDSKITFHEETQSYAIHGLVIDDMFNIYEEGTYSIGTIPPSYRSTLLSADTLPSDINLWVKNKKAYTFVQEGWIADNNLTLRNDVTSIDIVNERRLFVKEKWLISNDVKKQLSRLNTTDKIQRFLVKLLLPDTNLVREDVTFNLNGSNKIKKIRLGRYQNRLVFDDFLLSQLTDEPSDNQYIYLDVKGTDEGNGYKPQGYTVEELINQTKQGIVWWADFINDEVTATNHVFKTNERAFLVESNVVKGTSLINPVGYTQYAFNISPTSGNEDDIDNSYPYPNKEGAVGTYRGYNQPFTMKITDLRNWDRVISANENVGQPNIVAWSVNYAYTLTHNYPGNPPMNPYVLKHWVDKGFNPEMFTFDETSTETNAKLVYSKDGKSLTITGAVKVDCRYTLGNQTVFDKSEILFRRHHWDDYEVFWFDASQPKSGNVVKEQNGIRTSNVVLKRMYQQDINHDSEPCLGPEFEDELPIPYLKSIHTSRKDADDGLPVNKIIFELGNINVNSAFICHIGGTVNGLHDTGQIKVRFNSLSSPNIEKTIFNGVNVEVIKKDDAGHYRIVVTYKIEHETPIGLLVPKDAKDFNIVDTNNVFRREYSMLDLAFRKQHRRQSLTDRQQGQEPLSYSLNQVTVIDACVTENYQTIALPCRIMFFYYQPEELFEDEVGIFKTRQLI